MIKNSRIDVLYVENLNNMDKINDKQKDGYSNTFMLAFEKEGLTRTEVAEIFECNPVHLTWIKNKKYWSNIPLLTWNKIKNWVESRKSLKEYGNLKKPAEDSIPYSSPKPAVSSFEDFSSPKSTPKFIITTYEIEHGIPIPEKEKAPSIFPFDKMQVGDSFKVPIILNKTPKSKYNTVHTAIGRYRKTHPEQRFAIRYICKEECIRCWRIE